MQPKTSKRSYSPQFSNMATVSVRRLAWAMGKSMPAAVDLMVQLMPFVINPLKICAACQDKSRCQGCCFHNPSLPQGLETLEAVF
jgi:hypothetical protein